MKIHGQNMPKQHQPHPTHNLKTQTPVSMVAPPSSLEGAGTGACSVPKDTSLGLSKKNRLAMFNGKSHDHPLEFGGYFAFFKKSWFLLIQ